MAPMTRAQRRAYHAQHRRLQQHRERLQREQACAQRHLQAREPAWVDGGVAETLADEVQWRRKAVRKRLGPSVGLMFPTVCGCRPDHELTRGRAWDQPLPARRVGALPTPKWLRQWPHRGPELLVTRGHAVVDPSAATRSRWPWTWVGDDRGFKTSGQQLGRVGTW